jgi:ribonuclease R
VTRVGLFVKLAETGADGFVPAGTLGDDYFRFEEGIRALVGTRSGVTYRLGDSVRARLVEAAPYAGALRFEIVADEADGALLRRGARHAGREWRERTSSRRGQR